MKAAKADGASGAAAAIIAIVIGATDSTFASTTLAGAEGLAATRCGSAGGGAGGRVASANCGIGAAAKGGAETTSATCATWIGSGCVEGAGICVTWTGAGTGFAGRNRCRSRLGLAGIGLDQREPDRLALVVAAGVTPTSEATWSEDLAGVASFIHCCMRASSWFAGTSCAATVRALVQSPDKA